MVAPHVRVDKKDNIFVPDIGSHEYNSRVIMFSTQGEYLKFLELPTGQAKDVCVDEGDNILSVSQYSVYSHRNIDKELVEVLQSCNNNLWDRDSNPHMSDTVDSFLVLNIQGKKIALLLWRGLRVFEQM